VKTIRIPAEIILTFPAQVKVTEEIAQAASFACEQHLNGIGMINYTGPMIQTGTLSFGLRVHMTDPIMGKGEVVERFPTLTELADRVGVGMPSAADVIPIKPEKA
jgi:hypothetical protein